MYLKLSVCSHLTFSVSQVLNLTQSHTLLSLFSVQAFPASKCGFGLRLHGLGRLPLSPRASAARPCWAPWLWAAVAGAGPFHGAFVPCSRPGQPTGMF